MKITEIEPIHLRLPNVEDLPDGTLDVLVVRIHTDAGLTGIGEVTSQSYVCKAIFEAPRSAQRRHGLNQLLIGRDVTDVESLWEYLYYQTNRFGRRGAAIHAISGADIALWDLVGKAQGKPVFELLGGGRRDTVRAYASYLFGDTPEETAALAAEAVSLGLTAAKFGWGPLGEDPDVDVAHIRAAREVLGDQRDLMVDAGHAWDFETALDRARRFEPFGIDWLEEPLSQDDRKGYAQLCAASPVPIAAGEGDVTHWDFEDLIERGVHVIQPDVAFCGGLTVCRRVSEMTERLGRRAVPHCFSTGINLAASLHWMAATPSGDLVEYCLRPSPLMRKLVANLPPLVDGRVPVPQGPGLGIELDEAIVEQYRV
ncbi:MAG: mandelate racemase/muconate lactonizing enzyme family protein [Pirellulaceae bacterium]|jgi:L-alanine-DL-glutamate epimerase-like enolase superfamily enzyme|nr:mandelate racemase/muconate lactonizing enzyme family protein [Pirellulaceae bacterium]MDP7018249.1 mandelate racemase/muconate lactonizing enzyme family protein [Pirellulaceae bacterium]